MAGCAVTVPAHHPAAAQAATASLDNVTIVALDLADLSGVQAFATSVVDAREPVHILINNAGVMATPERRIGPGWESQFAINHLGHFALVNHLLPALAAEGGRVVSVSSAGHHNSPIRWDDMQFTTGYDKWLAYGQSKTANALFAVHLDAVGAAHSVRAYSLHPGKILTPLQRHLTTDEMVGQGWIYPDGSLADPTFKTPAQGAATAVWAATSPQLETIGGVYCEDCNIAPIIEHPLADPYGVRDYACDPDNATRLWHISEQLTSVHAFVTE